MNSPCAVPVRGESALQYLNLLPALELVARDRKMVIKMGCTDGVVYVAGRETKGGRGSGIQV